MEPTNGDARNTGIISGQRGFILPRDAPRPEDDRVAFMAKAISMEDIEELATGMLAKHVLFIFDSCFSGTLLRGEAHPEPITRKTTKRVRQFITAGSAAEQVPDESVFQTSLLNALDGDADQTGDGYVTGEELGWYLKGRVMEYSNGAQTPQYGKIRDPNLDQGDIVFVLADPTAVPPPVQFGHLQVSVTAPNSQVFVDVFAGYFAILHINADMLYHPPRSGAMADDQEAISGPCRDRGPGANRAWRPGPPRSGHLGISKYQ